MNSKSELFDSLDLNSKKNIAIIGSSFCSCLLGDYLKIKYGAKIVFYEKTRFIGGAWRSDNFGNVFSNIIAPTTNSQKKVFKKVLIFLKKKKIKIRRSKYNSFYANQIVDSYIFDFNHFYKKIKETIIIKKLKVNFILEKDNHVLINNKFKHDYVLFPNSVNIKKITKKSKLRELFKIHKGKVIKSKHIRIICKDISKDNFKNLHYSEQTLGPVDRLQATEIKKKLKFNTDILIKNKEIVKVITLDSYVKKKNLKFIDLLKIDTQGYEEKIFKGCKNIFKKNIVKFIEVEYIMGNQYITRLNIIDLEKYLIKNGFRLFGINQKGDLLEKPDMCLDLLYANTNFVKVR